MCISLSHLASYFPFSLSLSLRYVAASFARADGAERLCLPPQSGAFGKWWPRVALGELKTPRTSGRKCSATGKTLYLFIGGKHAESRVSNCANYEVHTTEYHAIFKYVIRGETGYTHFSANSLSPSRPPHTTHKLNPSPSPSGPPLLSGPPTLIDIHQIFTKHKATTHPGQTEHINRTCTSRQARATNATRP